MEDKTQEPKRNRSVDAITPQGTELKDIFNLLWNDGKIKVFHNDVEAVFQNGRNSFNITFKDNDYDTREKFLKASGGNIMTPKGTYRFQKPMTEWTKVNLRAVPTEYDNEIIHNALREFGCGNIIKIEKVFHRGSRLYNGYRKVYIDSYKEGRLPQFIKIGNVISKIFLPERETEQTCSHCLKKGHIARQCKNAITCWSCFQQGHKKKECRIFMSAFPFLNIELEENEPLHHPHGNANDSQNGDDENGEVYIDKIPADEEKENNITSYINKMDEEGNEEGTSDLREDEREGIEQTREEPDIPSEGNELYENKAELPMRMREHEKNEEASGEDESALEMTTMKAKKKRQRRKRKKESKSSIETSHENSSKNIEQQKTKTQPTKRPKEIENQKTDDEGDTSRLFPTEQVKQSNKRRTREISSIIRPYKSESDTGGNDGYIRNLITRKPLYLGTMEHDTKTMSEIIHTDSEEQWRLIRNKEMAIKKVDNSRLPIKTYCFVYKADVTEDGPKIKVPQVISKIKRRKELALSMMNYEMGD